MDDAVRIFSQMEKVDRLAAPETGNFVNALLSAGKVETAHQLWTALLETPESQPSLLSNGSFEAASPAHLSQFDWQLRGSEYAQLTIDSSVAHTGTKSLRLDFFGRDTTRLTNEIKQLIVVRPGTAVPACGLRANRETANAGRAASGCNDASWRAFPRRKFIDQRGGYRLASLFR